MSKFKNNKVIISGGCSFTAGHDLADWNGSVEPDGICHTYSNRTWDSIIHRKMSPHSNLRKTAMGGHGYGAITRRIIYECEQQLKTHKPEEIIVLVMWTSALRREFVSIHEEYFYEPEQYFTHTMPGMIEPRNNPHWKDVKKRLEKEKLVKTVEEFYNKRFTRDNVYYYSLQQYEYLTNYLKANNIMYFYTGSYNDLASEDTMQENNIFIHDMYKRLDIKNNVCLENGLGFNEWATKEKLPKGVSDHPLEEAQLRWAKKFIKWIESC